VFVALIIFRQVYKGRIMNIGQDLSDLFIAFTTGNTDQLTAILARTGDGNTATVSDTGVTGVAPDTKPAPGTLGIAASAEKRGKAAKGYRWAATGPDYYDCSGLIWRACQDNGYTGVRFTTSTIQLSKQMVALSPPATNGPFVNPKSGAAGINDIVVWSTGLSGHMGVITAPGKFYSARNVQDGIGESPIAGFHAGTPKYYRLVVN
jgi:cell wall-associated NlpC family hydrolase